ncbi:translation elongation factor Ts [Pacificimonas flava]|uniref:Elongation factor Ts n=2 Tax=Pacificimonas TaxID=1960290 RepID=A0A219B6V9_9SPHN|nr:MULTISPECIES: translation elongation factor Ts [Pacificimonas]MBZ6378602.1 elongation factor Ts [Pacificimonas aurantium]OWV34122.1 translation elongation factor Ts [Pacificimonas flava]
MAEITAKMVKDLRERSGAGMMDCKKALNETNGDMEAAVDWLRTKGLAAAQKKSSRTAAEGLIGVAAEGTTGAVVEVNSETDFVAKNEKFQQFVANVTAIALEKKIEDVEALKTESMADGKTVADRLTDNIATIGENQQLRRAAVVSVSEGVVSSYVHNQMAPDLGKIGVLVALESTADKAELEAFGKQLAMHIAAAAPLALDESRVDDETIARERAIATEKAKESGKPDNIVEKMVEGSVRKFLSENTLLGQVYVIDGKAKVSDVVAAKGKELGAEIKISDYARFQLGEGIEREESDFAAEVAAAVGQ